MRKSDVIKSKYFRAADMPSDWVLQAEIELARVEKFEGGKGKNGEAEKLVVYFLKQKTGLGCGLRSSARSRNDRASPSHVLLHDNPLCVPGRRGAPLLQMKIQTVNTMVKTKGTRFRNHLGIRYRTKRRVRLLSSRSPVAFYPRIARPLVLTRHYFVEYRSR
jgi:hypothetical protein